MAFPTIATTNSGNSGANATNHTINLPASIAAGDLLLIFFVHDDGSATVTASPPADWSTLVNNRVANDAGTQARLSIWYKTASGSEGATATATTTGSEGSAHVTYRITGWHGTTIPEASAAAPSSSANPDPPNLDPTNWAAEDTLWIAAYGWDNGNITHSSYPANYTLSQLTNGWTNAGGARIAVSARQLNASAEDPGTGTLSAGEQWAAATVAVRPSGGGGGAVKIHRLETLGVG